MSVTLERKVFQSSELSRQPLPVFEAATVEPVEITRRDDDTLVLMSKRENDARDRLLELAAQIIAITVEDDPRPLGERCADVFNWMWALDAVDREQCALDLIRASRASFATKKAYLAMTELASWQATAAALADDLSNEPIQWHDINEPVEKP
ncbi:prevent-host-death protein [Aurantimicrobium sp. MWH-Uga1]|uniref:prevent-host-death protein n=1 Tax=Aurantimicrobium sp. MWH-Uga1 TaxID=2079575 RepID=UPI000DED4DC3|nr:prevent-host-death protein [Aurantimicrobium sp. MWH-Uga1]AXE54020.1 hypothetical protein AURUGA1_00311 [Aurantimicrobium sp. MWH-Uga1]